MDNLEILFLGLLFKENDEINLLRKSKVGLNNSVNTFQWNIIKGILSDKSANVKILNSIPCGNYPFLYNKLFIKSNDWNYMHSLKNKEIGFINFYIMKHFMRFIRYMKEVKKWIKDTQGRDRCIILYDMYVPFMQIIKWIKRKYPDVKTNIIIGDLPNEYSHNFEKYKNTLKGYILYCRGKKSFNLIQYFDSFVFLTKYMGEPLGIKDKPYVVVEGIVDSERESNNLGKKESNRKIIMYAGTLNKQYGIDTLLEAFGGIEDNNYELWLCGNGDMNNKILDAANKDSRIKYYGYVSKSQLLQMEKEITAYVNPRINIGTYIKYSFPSKTIEYLASGKPIIMHKLDGIPNEYDDYIFFVEENSAASLRDKICEVCGKSSDELHELGIKGRKFVFEKKNNISQANKLLEMLRSLKKRSKRM